MNEREMIEGEIEKLKHELSVTIPQEIQMAIEQGDLRDNSEFSSAMAKQHYVQVRLKQLVERLKAYKAIDLSKISKDKIGLGSEVKVRHLENNRIEYFKIVMVDIEEVNGKCIPVTIKSPIGKTLLNRTLKEEVIVSLPIGKATYRILDIRTIHDLLKGT